MNKALIHKNITQTLQQVTESVMLSDWRTLSKEHILQDAARLRSIKAQYVATHLTHQLEIHQEVLSPLDQALLALYLLLDTLEGRDLARQRDIYHALLEAQTPLLLACSVVPSVGEVQVDGDDTLLLMADRAENIRQEADVPDLTTPSVAPSQGEIPPIISDTEGSGSSTWFRWTEARERQLEEAIIQLVGSLDRVDMGAIKKIAAQYDWPYRSIEYKVRRLKTQQSPREVQQEEEAPAKEGD